METKFCHCCGTEKLVTEFHKNRTRKDGLQTQCKVCINAANAKCASRDRDGAKRRSSEYYQRNKEKVCSRSLEWRKNNPEKVKEAGRKSRQKAFAKAPDRIREINRRSRMKSIEKRRAYDRKRYAENKEERRLHVIKWQKANSGILNSYSKQRKAAKLRAIPGWADLDVIKQVYVEARLLSKSTGESWHVDHIVPLQSPLVCGLHVQQNLCVMNWRENIVKGNRVWPDMP